MAKVKIESKYPLVTVTWIDATHVEGWFEEDEALNFGPKVCFSSGYLLPRKSKKFISLAQSYSDSHVADILIIPTSEVVDIKKWI